MNTKSFTKSRSGRVPVGCVSAATSERLQLNRLFQESFTHVSGDSSLREFSLRRLDYSIWRLIQRSFATQPGKLLSYGILLRHFSTYQPGKLLSYILLGDILITIQLNKSFNCRIFTETPPWDCDDVELRPCRDSFGYIYYSTRLF